MKRVAVAIVLVMALVACAKEEWNRNQIGVPNPYSDTDETEPAAEEEEAAETGVETTSAPIDAGKDGDARPADARTDARDATPG